MVVVGLVVFGWLGLVGGVGEGLGVGVDGEVDVQRAVVGLVWVMLTALPMVAGVWASAFGFGCVVAGWLSRGGVMVGNGGSGQGGLIGGLPWSVRGVCGFMVWAWLWLVVGSLGGYRLEGVIGVTAVGWLCLAVAWWRGRRAEAAGVTAGREVGGGEDERRGGGWFGLVFWMPGAAWLWVAAACPPGTMWAVEAFGYDVMSYHLVLPGEWLAGGKVTGLDHSVYSFLPSLMEVAYGGFGAVIGSMREAVYASALLHATLGLATAWCVADVVGRVGRAEGDTRGGLGLSRAGWGGGGVGGRVGGGAWGGGAVLLTPWVVVVGSQAYNELAVTAALAAAVWLAVDPGGWGWRRVVVMAGLVGSAALAKPTAVLMVGLPLAVAVVVCGFGWVDRHRVGERWGYPTGLRRWGGRWVRLMVGLVVAAAVMFPWHARVGLATGNPVYPLLASVMGDGGTSTLDVERWERGHAREVSRDDGAWDAVWDQWVGNAGYGAAGGRETARSATEVARFARQGGVSLLLIAGVVGLGLGVWHRRTRRLALAMGLMLGVQVACWLGLTHRQSRFLVPTVVPMSVLTGMAWMLWPRWVGLRGRVMSAVGLGLATTWGVAAASVSFGVLMGQTRPAPTEAVTGAAGGSVVVSPGFWVDQLDAVSAHPLADGGLGRAVVVADQGALLYAGSNVVYASAFNRDPLAGAIQRVEGQAGGLAEALRDMGVEVVWVNFAELRRLEATYGIDPELRGRGVMRAMEGWEVVYRDGSRAAWRVPMSVP